MVYIVIKGGIRLLIKIVVIEFVVFNVRVNFVYFGFMEIDMIKDLIVNEEVKKMVLGLILLRCLV